MGFLGRKKGGKRGGWGLGVKKEKKKGKDRSMCEKDDFLLQRKGGYCHEREGGGERGGVSEKGELASFY